MEYQLLEFSLTRVPASLRPGPLGLSLRPGSLGLSLRPGSLGLSSDDLPSAGLPPRVRIGAGALVRDVMISTEKPVRSGGGICRAAGAVLAPYLRNPVVMWAHNYREPPVAKATALVVEPGVGISAKFEFPAPGVYPLADVVRGLWDGGFINAASIGFAPLEWEMIPDPEAAAPKTPTSRTEAVPVFTKWELYEFSLVAVPRDREALRRAFEFTEPLTVGGLRSDNDGLRCEIGLLEAAAGERLADAERGGLVAVAEREALIAAAGSLSSLDLQRLLDGLRAVRGAYHA